MAKNNLALSLDDVFGDGFDTDDDDMFDDEITDSVMDSLFGKDSDDDANDSPMSLDDLMTFASNSEDISESLSKKKNKNDFDIFDDEDEENEEDEESEEDENFINDVNEDEDLYGNDYFEEDEEPVSTQVQPQTKKKPAVQEPRQTKTKSTAAHETEQHEMEDVSVPQWVVLLKDKLEASVSHAFILDGNIRDYMIRSISINDGIVMTLDPTQTKYEVIANYDQAHGLTFFSSNLLTNVSQEEYQERFIKIMQTAQAEMNIEVTKDIPKDPVLLFMIIAYIFDMMPDEETGASKMLLFADFIELLVPEGSSTQLKESERKLVVILSNMFRSQAADEAGNCIILKTDDISQMSGRVHSTSSRIDRISIPNPLMDERMDFILNELDIPQNVLSDGRQIFECEEGVDQQYLATSTAGLACYQIEDIVLRALSNDSPITAELVKERKSEIIKIDYDGVIEVMEPTSGFEALGGMQQLKDFFKEVVIEPIHRGELEAVPMGVLMMGPPGTGKTVLAKAVAFESGMNCVALNLNKIMGKYVGQSEHNLDRALDCALAMQPTIIFIDEIDEALPKRNVAEQSAVNQRINKRLLEFFSQVEHRGQVMILAATNYPEKIDPAFKRAGRFDKRLPMFGPDRFDRMRIIKIVARNKGYTLSCIGNPDTLYPNPFTGLLDWFRAGNCPQNEGYVGNQSEYSFERTDDFGSTETITMYLPDILTSTIGEVRIPLWQVYRCCEILLENILEDRKVNASTAIVESDEDYFRRMENALNQISEVFDNDPETMSKVFTLLKIYDKIYRPFQEQTDYMTGAELDVVLSKAITIFRKWTKEHDDLWHRMLNSPILENEKDIPFDILYEACVKTTNATAGIKTMEDNALINTSDTDFIPDAKYGVTNDGKEISYLERQTELVNKLQFGRETD